MGQLSRTFPVSPISSPVLSANAEQYPAPLERLSAGFMVCKDCGAAVPGDDEASLRKIGKPYRRQYADHNCRHPAGSVVNTYLGNQFRTDMVVYEITLDARQVDVSPYGFWLRRAGQTLAEAMTLAGGRLLDIEFNEIKSGYRLRYSEME